VERPERVYVVQDEGYREKTEVSDRDRNSNFDHGLHQGGNANARNADFMSMNSALRYSFLMKARYMSATSVSTQ